MDASPPPSTAPRIVPVHLAYCVGQMRLNSVAVICLHTRRGQSRPRNYHVILRRRNTDARERFYLRSTPSSTRHIGQVLPPVWDVLTATHPLVARTYHTGTVVTLRCPTELTAPRGVARRNPSTAGDQHLPWAWTPENPRTVFHLRRKPGV